MVMQGANRWLQRIHGGVRVGWLLGPNPITRREEKTQSKTSGGSSSISLIPNPSPPIPCLGFERERIWCEFGEIYGS
jgi:hypothetical protein